MKWLLALAALAAAALLIKGQGAQAEPGDPPSDDTDQETTTLDDIMINLTPSTYATADVPQDTADTNSKAFLDMLAYSEGTSGPSGYQTLFGGGIFQDMSDHPRQRFSFTNKLGQTLTTTAAGRYQFLERTWDSLQKKLNLPDFGPASQDAAALELVRQRGALVDVQAGRLEVAISKCAPIWASLPGAGYAQPERKLSTLVAQYSAAGGNIEGQA
jgi:muramidase (phage lysozyme)